MTTTIYSFVPVKKRMKILEFINYHLQQFPKCQLSDVKVINGFSLISYGLNTVFSHLELKFRGLEGVSLLIPLFNYNEWVIIYHRLTFGDVLFEKSTITEALNKVTELILIS